MVNQDGHHLEMFTVQPPFTVQHDKQHHVALSSTAHIRFNLNGHTPGFHPRTQTIELGYFCVDSINDSCHKSVSKNLSKPREDELSKHIESGKSVGDITRATS